VTDWTLFESNARVWCAEMEAATGREGAGLDAVPDTVLAGLAGLGFDAVWLMGAWQPSARSRAIALSHEGLRGEYDRALPGWQPGDVLGSPYAVSAYEPAEVLGGGEGLARFRRRLADHGLGLVLDFVPNHTAVDHPWVRERPSLYVAADDAARRSQAQNVFQAGSDGPWIAHGRDPYFDGWTDTAQIDYRSAAARQAVTEALLSVAGLCDGVRCDMAMLALADVFDRTWAGFPPPSDPATGEFWPHAVAEVRAAHPGFRFLAEAYWGLGPRLAELGFDAVYDKDLYDALRGQDAGRASRLVGDDASRLATGVRFLENHDEARAASAFARGHQAAAVAALTLPGVRLLHMGQLEGARVKLPVQLGRRQPEPVDEGARALYGALLPVLDRQALRRGGWARLWAETAWEGDSGAANLLAWVWRSDGDVVLAVSNPSPHRSAGRVRLAGFGFGRSVSPAPPRPIASLPVCAYARALEP